MIKNNATGSKERRYGWAETNSGQDASPTVLHSGFVHIFPKSASFNSTTDSFSCGHDPFTLACKARPSFDGCQTSLSVSLSLSLLALLGCVQINSLALSGALLEEAWRAVKSQRAGRESTSKIRGAFLSNMCEFVQKRQWTDA